MSTFYLFMLCDFSFFYESAIQRELLNARNILHSSLIAIV